MNKFLIATNKMDAHADFVIRELNQTAYKDQVIRLNTEDFLTNALVSFRDGNMHILLKDSGREFSTSDVTCIWYRRPEDVSVPDTYVAEAREFAQKQAEHILRGLYYCISDEALWINPIGTARKSANKLKQLQIAKQIGFQVPETIITNKPDDLNKAAALHKRLCIKPLVWTNFIVNEQFFPFFTTELGSKEIEKHIDTVEACPTLFQQFIDKAFDLRVTIFGDEVHAVEIHSQAQEETRQDFRVIAPQELEHKPHQLPSEITRLIKRFVKYYDLVFSAFDFAVTVDGQYYFLENNPNGQWLWLEIDAGIPISKSLIQLILPRLN